MKTLITIVNYNTEELLSHLLFSLFRIVGHKLLSNYDIVVVDNNSSDQSIQIIKALEEHRLIRGIFNKKQMYHAHGLNQGLEIAIANDYDIYWTIDSDVIVLKPQVITDSIEYFRSRQIDILAQYNNAGEPHASCMMIKVETIKKLRGRFIHGGHPSRRLYRIFNNANYKVRPFPFLRSYYMLHVGCGTRKMIKEIGDEANEWYDDIADCSPWYHGDVLAPAVHNDFKQLFNKHIPQLTPKAIGDICVKRKQLHLGLRYKSAKIDRKILSPTARGVRNIKLQ